MGRFIGLLVNFLDCLPRLLKELLFNSLPSRIKQVCEDYWKNVKNMCNQNWNTDKEYTRPSNLSDIPRNFNPQNMSWKNIFEKYNIDPNKGLKLNRRGEIDWTKNALSKCSIEKKGLYNKYKDKFQDRGGGNNIQDEVGKLMAKKMNMPIDQFWKYKAENGLVIHEHQNLKRFELVPKEIHDNIRHGGGISVGKISAGLLSGGGICLVDVLIVILTFLCFIVCFLLLLLFINYVLEMAC